MQNYDQNNINAWFTATPPEAVRVTEALREIDLSVAISIASHANQRIRDKYSNINSEIWNLRFDSPTDVAGRLMTDRDIKVHLDAMITDHIAQNKSILMECDSNETLCTWLMEFIHQWEDKCRQKRSFDISDGILSVMKESLDFTCDFMEDTPYNHEKIEKTYKRILFNLQPTDTDHFKFLTVDEAVVRFFFRNEVTSKFMTLIAGKLLQKREVVNRAGSLASKIQKNTVTSEYDRAINSAIVKFQSLQWDAKFDNDTVMKYYAVDHTRSGTA
jgi:hypothetical protein